jgi:NAD(P)-dependent dehydrogenase (short-subunit alcohol dehydrogenase family)
MLMSYHMKGKVAVITGAGSGIGRAIALKLARKGLMKVAKECGEYCEMADTYVLDLGVDRDINRTVKEIRKKFDALDALVHCAGVIFIGTIREAVIDDFDRQYRINVRAPYLLTKELLELIVARQGQIVFINSSQGLIAGEGAGQYAATKHALKAIADSLRAEVNSDVVRVISIYPGQTASPMQAALYMQKGKKYCPERLLQPDDIAAVVLNALLIPRTAELTDISIRSLRKP